MTRHFLRDDDLTPAEQAEVLALAAEMKRTPYAHRALEGPRSVATIYDKPTLRTQASFSAAVAELGGNSMLVDGRLAGIGERESVADVARVLGRQAAVVVWRTYAQSAIEEMAAHAGVPVVNALTDDFHPCQLLADLLSLRQHKGDLAGLAVGFVGDGACNMGNSWVLAGATAGLQVRIGAPEGFAPDPTIVERARDIAGETGGSVTLTDDAREAVAGADAVVTDTWVSMGKEEQRESRIETFSPYAVTSELFGLAKDDAVLLHCLPAYRGKEVAAEVIDGPRSVVWDEAENRRHAQKAIITWLLDRGRR
jgi:ornithine carbamoyltransferase